MFLDWPLLSLVIWTPIIGGLFLLAFAKKDNATNTRFIALLISILTFILSIPLYLDFDTSAAMYCSTLSLMTSQPAITTITVMNVVNTIKGIDIPSIPR